MATTKEEIFNIIAIVDPHRAITAPQNEDENASPFSSEEIFRFFQRVVRANKKCKIVKVNETRAIQLGYGNDKKVIYSPMAEGHIFFRSMTEGIIPIARVIPPYLPDLNNFEKRSAYGTFGYKTETTIPQGGVIYMLVKDGIYYWIDYLKGRRPGAFQLYWVAAVRPGIKTSAVS